MKAWFYPSRVCLGYCGYKYLMNSKCGRIWTPKKPAHCEIGKGPAISKPLLGWSFAYKSGSSFQTLHDMKWRDGMQDTRPLLCREGDFMLSFPSSYCYPARFL